MKSTRKTRLLAVIVCMMMIVAMLPMGVVTASDTPSGTAITSAAEFAAMDADGAYYLANDITLIETYANEFTGTFDGNGKTITTSVPVFGNVTDAVIRNFTVSGDSAITTGMNVEASKQTEKAGLAVGAVACTATNSTFRNLTNNVSVVLDSADTSREVYCGGILGLVLNAADQATKTELYFEDCVNNAVLSLGAVNSNSAVGGIVGATRFTAVDLVSITISGCENNGKLTGPKAAGMIGYIQHTALLITDCTNSADLTATGLVGGMVSQAGGTNRNAKFVNCVNSGNLGGAQYAGGILAYVNNSYGQIFINCRNSGAVTSTKNNVGGILGAANTVKSGTTDFYGCVNSGAITNEGSSTYAGGIVAFINANGGTVKNCVNSGTVMAFLNTAGIVGDATKGNVSVIGCINSGTIYSTRTATTGSNYFGGIVGYMKAGGSITGCANLGDIKAASDDANVQGAGGIVGQLAASVLTNCYNTGSVEVGYTFAGGLVGAIVPNGKVSNSYTSGIVTGKNGTAVAQIGVLHNTTTSAEISNVYYNEELNAGLDAFAYSGSGATDDGAPTTKAFTSADLASGKLAHDMNTAAGEIVFYQNLAEDRDATPVLDASHGTVFYVNDTYTSISVATESKAAIRIAGDATGSGLRFVSSVNKAEYDALIAAGISEEDITVGTVIAPLSFVTAVEDAGGRFTMADFDKILKNENKYLNVTVDAKGQEAFFESDASAYRFRGSVVHILDYTMDFCAVGYIKVGDVYVYSTDYSVRNIADIAREAYADRGEQSEAYGYEIPADSENAIGGVVTFSPYTDRQLTIIKSFFENANGGNA